MRTINFTVLNNVDLTNAGFLGANVLGQGGNACTGWVVQCLKNVPSGLGFLDYIRTGGTGEITNTEHVTLNGFADQVSANNAAISPMHDQAIVRRFRTIQTDPSNSTPIDAKTGYTIEMTVSAGSGASQGDTLTDSATPPNVAKALWAHPVSGGKQTLCYYWITGGPTFTYPVSVTPGGSP